MSRKLLSIFLIISLCSCSLQNNVLKQVSSSRNSKLAPVFKNAQKYELQIIYSRIVRKNGKIQFKDYKYRVDPEA